MNTGYDASLLPYHRGECDVQRRAGTREQSADVGRHVFRDFMPDQHREFFGKLSFIIAGAMDEDGQPWASLFVGASGFMTTPTARRIEIAALPAQEDPVRRLLQGNRPLGLLGIDLQTRRRNRLNGVIAASTDGGVAVDVRQSFGNCPRYIQARELRSIALSSSTQCLEGDHLDAPARALIAAADTFFIATAHPAAREARNAAQGVDVSHRGGRPGFVQIDARGNLSLPDYSGNGFFNTLGNLQVHPRAGLLFVDFDRGHLLHVAADAEIVWDGPDVGAVQGAERLLRLRPRRVVYRENALQLACGPPSLSPHLPNPEYW